MTPLKLHSESGRAALAHLLEQGPVLVEVRFPHVSSDWHLVNDLESFEEAVAIVRAGVPIATWSVLDIALATPALLVLSR